MDKPRRHSTRYNTYYTNEISTRLTTPSTAEKIQDIRQQLEQVLESAYNKRTKKTPRSTRLGPVVQPIVNNRFAGPSLNIRESSNEFKKNEPFQNDCVIPADAKLIAYKKFISSLTRIIQDTNQQTPNSFSMSTSINVRNESICTQKRSVEEKGTFLIQKDLFTEPYSYDNQDNMYETHAEKTTYCRPVAYNQELLNKTIEKNAKLQQLVTKLVQARAKEKQNEAWNNYINELRNKHGNYDLETKNIPKSFEREIGNTINVTDNSYVVRHSWKQPNLGENMFNGLYHATNSKGREESNIRRRTCCLSSTSKSQKYTNNSFCCPISSQGHLMMMRKKNGGLDYTYCLPSRYFRGSSILAEKESSGRKKSSTMKSCGIMNTQKWSDTRECRAIQTTDSNTPESEPETKSRSRTDIKDSNMLGVKYKFEQVSSNAENLKNKIKKSRDDNKISSLFKIEHKLDILIDSFNVFIEELKTKKMFTNVKSAAVSCSSMINTNNMFKTKSDTFNVLTKHNILCEVAQQKPHSLAFPACPISQGTINEILNEEKDKSEKVKKDIDDILNNTQCAVQITIDIPTKEHSTELSSSFYKRQEDTIVEEIEPVEGEELEKIERSMTIAVNTDPMGILALFRVSAETVKQILSYVPNLDYVTYLARRQLDNSNAVARYVCNICSATFTRPSELSDHIQGHNIDNSKNCCVCRHVLDKLSHRSGLFACAYCGQMFTRAYCRELHEQTCSMAGGKRGARPSMILLT